jgi:Family of unknown function (DUF6088)
MATSTPKRPALAPSEKAILGRVRRWKSAKSFKPADFIDLMSRDAIDQALSRLVAKGLVRRISRGVYDLPRVHPILGPLLSTPGDIRKALAGKGLGLNIQASGAYAANILGLTEQVPTRIVLLTDGPPRKVQVGAQVIELRQTSPRNMKTAGKISGTVIQALRHLGKDHVDEAALATLRTRLADKDKLCLRQDAGFAPAWIAKIMLQLAEG